MRFLSKVKIILIGSVTKNSTIYNEIEIFQLKCRVERNLCHHLFIHYCHTSTPQSILTTLFSKECLNLNENTNYNKFQWIE